MDLNQQDISHPQEVSFYPVPHSHWFPRPIAFRAYNPSGGRPQQDSGQRRGRRLQIQVSRPLPVRLTKEIVDTYQVCHPGFEYSESCNPKRYLTNPSVGVSNNGSDNENHDLILYFGRILANDDNTRRYIVKDLVGCGTFGQVAKCLTLETNDFVAVKVIKNQRAYSTQAKVEIGILHVLNKICDWKNEHHVVRSFDHFSCEGHLCIVFELLGVNLFELLKTNHLKGISLQLVRIFTSQLLDALSLLYDARVIHCDLKPENILLKSLRAAEIKLIDFGSACMEEQTVYSYIQSRFYRSPEVVLGHSYSAAIDMWSLGCVAAELFLGLPLFPGQCAYDLLLFIIEKLGKQPPDHILQNAKFTSKYFKITTAAPQLEDGKTSGHASAYQFLSPEENEARENKKPVIGKRYMSGTLEQMIMTYPMKPVGREEADKEMLTRRIFVDFLRGLIEVDPHKRWTPRQASQHPFLTEGPFTGPFKPRKDPTPRKPAGQAPMMEHRVSTGHWFGAGLSPHVGTVTLSAQLNGGQQFQPSSFTLAGSPASFGSVGDSGALGSSLGSNGDGSALSMSIPPGLNGHTSLVAGSPEVSWRPMQPMQSTGQTQLGMSPSAGGVRPLSVGVSPSHQFTIPGPHFQASPSSQHVSSPGSQYVASPGTMYHGSPGSTFQSSPGSSFRGPASPSQGSPRYGPTSPAYTVREAAIAGQFNKRRNAGLAALPTPLNGSGAIPYDNVFWSRIQQNNAGGNMDAGTGNFSQIQGAPQTGAQWRMARSGGNMGILDHPQSIASYPTGTLGSHFFTSETSTEAGEEEAGPGDWDADFREEHLFEHDPLPESAEFSMPSKIGPSDGVMGCGGARLGPGPGCGSCSGQGTGSTTGPIHPPNSLGLSRNMHGQTGLPVGIDGNSASLQGPIQGSYAGYGRGQISKHGQTSPSRLGQQHRPQHHKQSQYSNYHNSPQQSLTSVSYSGQSSGPNSGFSSRRFHSGESSSHSSPAGVLHFQQRQQHQYHSPHHSSDHQHLPASPLVRCYGSSFQAVETGKPPSDGLLPSPQVDTRGVYAADGNSGQLMGAATPGYVPAGSIPDGCVIPMAAGLGQPQFYGVGAPAWPTQHSIFSPGQIYATNQLFPCRKPGPPLVGVVRPPTGRGGCRFAK